MKARCFETLHRSSLRHAGFLRNFSLTLKRERERERASKGEGKDRAYST